MSQTVAPPPDKNANSRLIRGAIWVAIGALIASAVVCVVWLLIDDQDGLIGRAFLTILLLACFAGIAIVEAGLATKRPDWLAVTSMVTWIVALVVGMVKIWLPDERYFGEGMSRFFQLLLVVGILQLGLLHVRIYTPAYRRYVTTFTTIVYFATLGLLALLAGLLVFYLTFPDSFDYEEMYWKVVLAVAILCFLGTALVPLLNVLFAPKKERRVSAAPAAASWPAYADGVTPLPALPDGSPDWNAYYTGFPSTPPQAVASPQQQAAFPVAASYVPEQPVAVPPASPVLAAPSEAEVPLPPAPEASVTSAAPGAFPPPPPAPPL